MVQAVFLDSGPLGLVTQRRRKSPEADACRLWLENLLFAGGRIYVPEVADFEIRRELLRSRKQEGIARLDRMKAQTRYLPITTEAMLKAAEIWADARQRGIQTADNLALDADVVLVGQVLTAGYAPDEVIVATVNVRHISRYIPAEIWQKITR